MLTAVLRETPPKQIVELTERRYARPTVSRTFEGRDRFAPAAAWLAKGIAARRRSGRPVADVQRLDMPVPAVGPRRPSRGDVLRVDRFGNLVTNIDRKTFERFAQAGAISIDVGGRIASSGSSRPTPSCRRRASCALFGSTDHLELAAQRRQRRRARSALGRGAAVHRRQRRAIQPGTETSA